MWHEKLPDLLSKKISGNAIQYISVNYQAVFLKNQFREKKFDDFFKPNTLIGMQKANRLYCFYTTRKETQLSSGWTLIGSQLSSPNSNSSVRPERSFAIHYLNVVIKPLCGNFNICLMPIFGRILLIFSVSQNKTAEYWMVLNIAHPNHSAAGPSHGKDGFHPEWTHQANAIWSIPTPISKILLIPYCVKVILSPLALSGVDGNLSEEKAAFYLSSSREFSGTVSLWEIGGAVSSPMLLG